MRLKYFIKILKLFLAGNHCYNWHSQGRAGDVVIFMWILENQEFKCLNVGMFTRGSEGESLSDLSQVITWDMPSNFCFHAPK